MGKKKAEILMGQKQNFLDGCQANHIPAGLATTIFDLLTHFANYGFNKSHSAAYALVAWQTAYLKAHYPSEFMAAMLTSVMDTQKVPHYIELCRRMNIRILPPDINASDAHFTVDGEAIRFGLAAVRNVGENALADVVRVRREGGPFKDLLDFCSRVDMRVINKRVIESLIKCGAFDSTGARRTQLLAVLDQAVAEAQQAQKDNQSGQLGLFSEEALQIYKQAFNMALEQKNWHAMHVAFFDMMIETTFNDKESMIEREMDILMSDAIPDTIVNTQFARCLIRGVRAWNNGQSDSSLVYFKHLLDIAQQQEKPGQKRISLITANHYIAFWYLAHNRLLESIEVLKTLEKLSKEDNNALSLLDTYKNLSQFYRVLQNQEMAEHYHLLYLEGKDELVNKRKLGSAKEAQFLYELNKKNEQVRDMARREQMKSRVMWGALITAIVLLMLLVMLWVNNRRIKERNRQLYNKSLEMLRADEEKRELIERLQLSMPIEDEPKSPYAPNETPQREGKLSSARQSDILHRVFMVMETSDEIFSPDFSLPRLAELVGDTRNNVSEAINLRYQGNFNALVNEYRVKEACRRINDRTQWSDYTLEAIGQSVGFKSRSTFWTTFKEIVGLTPGAYQRMHH